MVVTPHYEMLWVSLGLLGQGMFFLRFFCQWLASEKEGRSVIPDIFWHFSIAGALLLLGYAVYRHDPVFILGQCMGLGIYIRNLMLVRKCAHEDDEQACQTAQIRRF